MPLDPFAVPPEPARNLQRPGWIPEELQRFQSVVFRDICSSVGGIQLNQSVIAPYASQLNNSGNVGITYQFAANTMIGASGTFTNLHYLDPAQAPGLFDSSSQGGSAFYTHRVSKMHYIGVTYQYQRLLSYPTPGTNHTQTQSVLLMYTLYTIPRFSISFFAGPQYANVGPQYSDTVSTPTPASQSWHPEAGGSLSWQGRLSSLAVSYSHMISGGGGLIGAVKMDSANASIRQQLSRALSASVSGGYTQNKVLAATPSASSDGHTVSGTASASGNSASTWTCSWDTHAFIKITARSLSWPRLQIQIANSFRFPISSHDRWEGNFYG